ncbi:MAG: hypothetical protein N3Z28_00670 [Synechococcaceae cyanobacterium MAG-AL2]|jgi:hypothetical protein|uniref:hypothetical protein n=1 Tax=Candidatus Regnicoccus frigidus TaxID=3074015 RepID=UPI0028215D4C|nr:hypothetical protein [Candidatus Regnicoccus frigidus]MCT4366166.1 hypothetical protein [Candidatus Regnicoccus frigidus MAG-AL2]
MRSRFILATALTTAAVVLIPTAALAQAVTPGSVVAYITMIGSIWFAIDKVIDLLPLPENTLIQFIRDTLNAFFAQQKQNR